MNSLFNMIIGAYEMLDTQYSLPWIGQTSILRMLIYLSLFAFLVDFVRDLIGGSSNE